MIELYSRNVAVTANSAVPFNNVAIKKGCTVEESAPATIQLNKCGVYMVSCDASVTAETDGDIELQLYKNGIAQPQAISTATGAADTPVSMGFTTLVQVSENNTRCCCSSPTTLQIMSNGVDTTVNNINVCVTKIC